MQSFAVNVIRLVVAAKVSLRPERELTMFFLVSFVIAVSFLLDMSNLMRPYCVPNVFKVTCSDL